LDCAGHPILSLPRTKSAGALNRLVGELPAAFSDERGLTPILLCQSFECSLGGAPQAMLTLKV